MVARFSDPKSLVFAYTDLVNMGIATTCLRVHFDEVADASQPQEEHHGFLRQLRHWLTTPHVPGRDVVEDPERPRSPLFKESGGVLEIDARGQDTAIVQVIVHHFGTLVD